MSFAGIEKRLLVGKRLLVCEQHAFIGHSYDVVVECACRDCFFRLLDEQGAFGVE
jgi:hypothetical protein